jgi:hypothetical protein
MTPLDVTLLSVILKAAGIMTSANNRISVFWNSLLGSALLVDDG